MPPTSRPRPTPAQILLGLFIAWQLLFLVAGNATTFFAVVGSSSAEPSSLSSLRSGVATATVGWEQLTGQGQGWRMFAPAMPARAFFLAVELGWRDKRQMLESYFEPASPERFFRPPGSGDRLWHVEKNLGWPVAVWEAEAVAQRPDEWRKYLEDNVRPAHRWLAYRSYLAWRLRTFLEEHPEISAPEEVTLLVRVFTPSAGPEQPARLEKTIPLVRWRPEQPPPAGCLPLEMHDGAGWYHLPAEASEGAP